MEKANYKTQNYGNQTLICPNGRPQYVWVQNVELQRIESMGSKRCIDMLIQFYLEVTRKGS